MPENENHSSALSTPLVYDYIVTGAGCAGLSFVIHLIKSGQLADKKVLIVDKDAKQKNDRTWCFWEKEEGLFQSIVFKEWKQLFFHSPSFSQQLNIEPYTYKLIRGIDFYKYCLAQIAKHTNITLLQAPVENIFSTEKETGIIAGGKKIVGHYIFNSIIFSKPSLQKGDIWMLQHFKGWFIHTNDPVFDAQSATLMDFKTNQSSGTTFFYVLPFSPTSALIEYTLFSDNVLGDDVYEQALQDYVAALPGIKSYQVEEKEFGVIPMTNFSFTPTQNNIINLGTAGGQTKGSSGYTFQFIQKHSAALVANLEKLGHPFLQTSSSKRFHFYDSVLLNVLQKKYLSGSQIFTHLFKKNKATALFKFLDNETTLAEDISILKSLPSLPFIKAAIRHLKGG